MKRNTVGLALGAGAAKGYAHIGVLQVLEQAGIPIDIIVGSSIGSLIGALYATGIDPLMLEKLAYKIRRRQWVDLNIPKMGLIAGNKIKAILDLLTKGKDFDELNLPLGVIVTDLVKKQSIMITKGNVAKAVRASIAMPGIFCPLKINNRILVDGGVLERVPGKRARSLGADFVIGVELGFNDTTSIRNIYDVLLQTFDVMGKEIQNLKSYDCDVLITPELGDIDPLTFNQAKKCIKEGRRATEKVLPEILKGIERR